MTILSALRVKCEDITVPEFVTASLQEHRSDLLSLNVTCMSWVFAEVDSFSGVRCADVVGMAAQGLTSFT